MWDVHTCLNRWTTITSTSFLFLLAPCGKHIVLQVIELSNGPFFFFNCCFYFPIRLISRGTDPVALGWARPAVRGTEPCLFGSPSTQKVTNWTRASVWPDSLNWRAQAAKCHRMSYRSCLSLYKKTIFRKMNSSWGQLCPGWVSSCCSGHWWSFCSVYLVTQSLCGLFNQFENCVLYNACTASRKLKNESHAVICWHLGCKNIILII